MKGLVIYTDEHGANDIHLDPDPTTDLEEDITSAEYPVDMFEWTRACNLLNLLAVFGCVCLDRWLDL
jgi:hypothetical protein